MIKPTIEIRNLLPNTSLTCFVVSNLFSNADCEQFLHTEVRNSFQKALSNYPTYYRNNDRYVVDNNDLADQLFEKVAPYLPKSVEVNSSIQTENGAWALKGLNSRLRYCKYSANQYFHRHLDGVHYQSSEIQSKLTFMIYLNSATAFKGGRTLFYETKETNDVWASYIPRQGDLIVFDHNVWHEGEVLTEGEKFVLRSDILYSKKSNEINTAPFTGHLGYIWSLLNIDKNTILSGGRDKEIKAWTLSGSLKYSLKGHKTSILAIEKITDDIFISGSRDQEIIVWNKREIVNRIKTHAAAVLSLCRLSKTTFASASGDTTIKISNLKGEVSRTFTEHTNWVWQVIKLEERVLASSSEDNSIKIWNCESEKSINTFDEGAPVISLVFNDHTRQLVSGDLQGKVTIRTLTEDYLQKGVKTFKAHTGIIRTIKFLNDQHIVTGGEDNKVKIWTVEGRLVSELKHENFVQAIEVLNEKRILSASFDGTIKSWALS